jgi:hypothetical protein
MLNSMEQIVLEKLVVAHLIRNFLASHEVMISG